MSKLLIKNARMVNEYTISQGDLLIENGRIAKIAADIPADGVEVLDAQGKYLLPGMIDDQVHFREPGFPDKGTIATESAAAVAGGITSYMEMPNVKPLTINQEAIDQKFAIAEQGSLANYSFYMGATNDNIDVLKAIDPTRICGIKVFMGASTGNMLVDNHDSLEQIFEHAPTLIVTHCEDSPIITANEDAAREQYGEDVPMRLHADIRSAEACLKSSQLATGLAKKHGSRLHVLHLTTEIEMELFTPISDLKQLADANITGEVCVHHLFFNQDDYDKLGSQIKCNPSVKTEKDRQALLAALKEDRLHIIATDHAPHTWEEKQGSYFNAPSGIPLVQHALLTTLELVHQGYLTLEQAVVKTAHAPAERYTVVDRGYLREGYFADLVLVDMDTPYTVTDENIRYHCKWSPYKDYSFKSSIAATIINGQIAYQDGELNMQVRGQALRFRK